MSAPTRSRTGGDRCPGALRLHAAADGPLARVRVPGGLLTGDAARALAGAADDLGDGRLHVTARGNVELRAVRDADGLAGVLAGAGLLPSRTHERVRNVLASPLAGLDGAGRAPGGLVDVVRDLDARLLARAGVARLSGRFVLGLDDGRGDVLALRPDLAAVCDGDGAEVLLGGGPGPLPLGRVGRDGIAPALAAAADAVAAHLARRGGDAWRLGDLAGDLEAVRADVVAAVASEVPLDLPAAAVSAFGEPGGGPALGVVEHEGRAALVARPRFGTTGADACRRLADLADAGDGLLRATPWRSVVVGGLAPDDARDGLRGLEALGLVIDDADPWARVGACTGAPGCGRALADVRADAEAWVERGGPAERGGRVYWSGCERRCGRPPGARTDIVATPQGYATSTPS